MIKLPYSPQQLADMANDFYIQINDELQIRNKLINRNPDEARNLFNYLRTHFTKIIKGTPDELERMIPQIGIHSQTAKRNYLGSHPTATNSQANKWLMQEIQKIFNYDFDGNSFTQKDDGALAYHHAEKRLVVRTCPYCNGMFTLTVRKSKTKGSKTRPDWDHFLYKGRHPYFALSFYNLIPCCQVCNRSLKTTKKFSYKTHIHPFLEGFEEKGTFRTQIKAADFVLDNKDFELKLFPRPGTDAQEFKKVQENMGVFAIDDRYFFHKDIAGEVIKKAYIYTNSTIEDLFKGFVDRSGQPLFKSEAEIKELILGNYLHPDNSHKRILSKLTKDIAEEFGLSS